MSQKDEILKSIAEIMPGAPQIFLDYDGTLVPIIKDPEKNQADPSLLKLISILDASFETYIVTGREIKDIYNFIGDYNIIGLHGAVFYIDSQTISIPGYNRYVDLLNNIYTDNKYLEGKFQGLKIYNKSGNIMFHLGNIKNEGIIKTINCIISSLAMKFGFELYHGIDIIEIRIPGINKGKAIREIRNRNRPAIIIGDDITDEDSFMENPDAITIKVGNGETHARFRIMYENVRPLLHEVIKISK
jgi:trehalose 6-phosphate phosphatase